jgi:hypothetical protein
VLPALEVHEEGGRVVAGAQPDAFTPRGLPGRPGEAAASNPEEAKEDDMRAQVRNGLRGIPGINSAEVPYMIGNRPFKAVEVEIAGKKTWMIPVLNAPGKIVSPYNPTDPADRELAASLQDTIRTFAMPYTTARLVGCQVGQRVLPMVEITVAEPGKRKETVSMMMTSQPPDRAAASLAPRPASPSAPRPAPGGSPPAGPTPPRGPERLPGSPNPDLLAIQKTLEAKGVKNIKVESLTLDGKTRDVVKGSHWYLGTASGFPAENVTGLSDDTAGLTPGDKKLYAGLKAGKMNVRIGTVDGVRFPVIPAGNPPKYFVATSRTS